MPNSRFALHGKRPSLNPGLCAFFASNSRFMRLFQAALGTPLDSPFSASLSVHGLHFTVYAPSKFQPGFLPRASAKGFGDFCYIGRGSSFCLMYPPQGFGGQIPSFSPGS